VAVDIPLDLDSGPIVWVKAELDATLLAALDGIARIQAHEADESVSATVRSNLHRASGAFELVGAEGLAVLVREFEMHFPDAPEQPSLEALQTVASACRRLVTHLEEIAVGAQPVPLRFLPEYLTLGRLRNMRFGPADLFFPDLSRKPRFVADAEPVEPSKLPAYLLRHRRDFQRGFLDWLRGTSGTNGIAIMERALAGIEAAHPLPSQRAFWWSTAALLEAAQVDAIGQANSIKQLFARIDLQIRRLVEGSTKVADRLKREVLYHVARVATSSPRCDEVKALYELDVLVPRRVPRELDIVALRPAIDRLNALVNRCKEEWASVSTQRAGAAERLADALAELPRACDAIGLRSLSDLGNGLANVAPLISTRSLTDEASLEFASCLLLLETSMQHLAALPRSFANEVNTAVKRLGFATSRAPIPAELLDDVGSGSLTRLAQERETVAHVCREIRTNMRQVEAALDAVFRDRNAVEDLGLVPGLLAQVSGALRLLGWNDANTVIAAASERVSALVADPSSAQPDDIDRIANVLAGFGFYVDARERKESGSEAILESLVRTLRGESAQPSATASEQSVEAALGARIRGLKNDYAQFRSDPHDERARTILVSGLNDVRRDAELIDDASLARAAKASLNLLTTDQIDAEVLDAEMVPIVGVVSAPQPVSAETQKILEAPLASQDTALLEIFIEEAGEVSENIGAAMSEYLQSPGRGDLLKDVRRGFHTLKGSGRMVGLNELGEAAWNVERVLNPVLEEGRSLTANEIELINVATNRFRGWVSELQSSGRANVGENPFAELVAKCGFTTTAVASSTKTPSAASVSMAAPAVPASSPIASNAHEELTFKAIAPIAGAVAAISVGSVASAKDGSTPQDQGLAFEVLTPIDAVPVVAPAAPALSYESTSIEEIKLDFAPETTALATSDTAPTLEALSMPVEASSLPPSGEPNWSDELQIDGVSVSRTLFSIMGDEARSHLSTLDQEISLMQFDPGLLPSDAMVRASHTLCGIHRTAGFNSIGNLAGQLEDALVIIRRTKHVEDNLALLADSIDMLRTSVLRLQAQMPMSDVERQSIADAAARLDDFIAASGGGSGGAAAEMAAHASFEEERSLDIEEFSFDLPENFDAPTQTHVTPVALLDVTAPSESLSVASTTPSPATEVIEVSDTMTASVPTTPTRTAEPEPVQSDWAAAATLATGLGLGSAVGTAVAGSSVVDAASKASIAAEQSATASPVSPQAKSATTVSTQVNMRVNAPLNVPAAPVAAPVSNEDPLIGINDDIDAQVLPIFLEEAHELFPAASSQLRAWRASPVDQGNLDLLKRTLHTLKGSARMAGAMRLGELTHIVESAVEAKSGNWTDAELDRVEERFDDVAFVLDQLVAGNYDVVLPRFAASAGDEPAPPTSADPESAADLIAAHVETGALPSDADLAAALPETVAAAVRDAAKVPESTNAKGTATPIPSPARAATQPAATIATAVAQAESAVAFLRVRTDAVELLADEAGEIAINRSRIESELRSLKTSLADLTSFVARLRTLLREIEIQGESQIQSRLDQESTFDPLEFDRYTRFQELTRGLAEGVNDVATVQQNLVKNIDDAETALAAQTRLSRSVQLRLQSLRTVPFSTVSERLYRVLRQTAKDVGKRANLDIEGGRIEIDRGVLERLIPVLEHLVRNSLAHGIEMPDLRKSSGKAEIGEINIAVKQQGNEVAIVFSDDGSGIALERVRQKAIAAGLAGAEDALNDAHLIEFIFRPGFTTADSVTAVAGRGVGMDVVRSELAALGGRVAAATTIGTGTTFTLSVPLTLAVTQVLLVEIAGTVYGIPSSLIETMRQVPTRDRAVALAAKQIDIGGKFMPFRSMSVLLGGRPDTTTHKTHSVAIVRAGDAVAAVEIDKVIGNQEVVAKPYGPQLARLPGMAGLTVLGDGKIVLLMDPLALLRSSADVAAPVTRPSAVQATPKAAVTVAETSVTAAAVVSPVATQIIESRESVAANEAIDLATEVKALAKEAPLVEAPIEAPAPPAALEVHIEPSAPEPEPEPEVIGRLPIVLVVDDSLTVRKITSRLLEREGYKAMTAKDGLDALQVLATVNPDVILLDIEMPRMDGFEFARTIKADNRQNMIPIIMITSRTAEKHRNHAIELGVNEYLGKPYQDDQLMQLVGKYTEHVVRPT
jgi:chemosensory pili system protein ChpA (sensor histidine kinase/response regulator)